MALPTMAVLATQHFFPLENWQGTARMSTGLKQPIGRSEPLGRHKVLAYGEFVDAQLSRVASSIRLNDLVWSLTAMATFVVGFLLSVILVDHWVWGLGMTARLICFGVLLAVVAWGVVRTIAPLLSRRINPAYAAQAIERSNPCLKDALLSLVCLRAHADSIRPVVYQTVERQAATALTEVDVDAAVDRGPLIKMGMTLCAMLLAFCVYLIFCPKDPLQTVARVVAPFAELNRPSRVRIHEVQPGDTQIYAGRQLDVTADVRGLRDGEIVALVYSSVDGQVVDQRIEMKLSRDESRWVATMPSADEGIHQDMTYSVLAGDTVAGPYQIEVHPAPSIVIDTVTYEYSAYTGQDTKTVVRQGDLNAIEGTRVTIHATANQDIDFAYIEFDPIDSPQSHGQTANSVRPTMNMQRDGHSATGSFTMQLAPDRRRPWHTSYQIKFTNTDGETNPRPIVHQIRVQPDLEPLVEILTPEMREISLPQDGRQVIEIRAVDPDYALSAIHLHAVAGGVEILNERLLNETTPGQQVVRYVFKPAKFRLDPGALVVYWATASDNRTAPGLNTLAPNVVKTLKNRFRIVERMRRRSSDEESDDEQNPAQSDPNQPNRENKDERQPRNPDEPGDDGNEPGNDENNSANRQPGDQGDPGDQGGEPGEAAGEHGSSQAGDGDDGDESGDGREQRGTDGQSSQNKSRQGDQGSDTNTDGGGGRNTSNPNRKPGDGGESGGESGGDNASDASDGRNRRQQPGHDGGTENPSDDNGGTSGQRKQASNSDQAQPRDGSPNRQSDTNQDANDAAPGDRPQEGSRDAEKNAGAEMPDQNTDQRGAEGMQRPGDNPNEALSHDGRHDGDAMERILKRILDKTGKEPESKSKCSQCNDGSCENCQSAKASGQPGGSEGSSGNKPEQTSDSPSSESNQDAQEPNEDAQAGEGSTSDATAQNESEQTGPAGSGSEQSVSEPSSDDPSGGTSGGGQPSDTPPGDPAQGSRDPAGKGNPTDPRDTSRGASDGGPADEQQDQPGGAANSQNNKGADNPARAADGNPELGNTAGEAPRGVNDSGVTSAGPDGDTDTADKENVEYARRATDMVLDYLQDDQNRHDRELLDQLGWTPEQMDEFLKRWQELKRRDNSPQTPGDKPGGQLDDVLRSLGLHPQHGTLRRAGNRIDRSTVVGDDGRRSLPPAEYRDRYLRYLRSVSDKR